MSSLPRSDRFERALHQAADRLLVDGTESLRRTLNVAATTAQRGADTAKVLHDQASS